MTPEEIAEYRKTRLRDLQDRALQLEGWRFPMYERAVWTAYLNRLDVHSPGCAPTIAEIDFWHNAAISYITGFFART